MNDDFEEDYEEEDDDWQSDLKDGIDKAKDAKRKYKEEKQAKNKSNNDPSQHNEARNFDKSLKEKNIARNNTTGAAQETTKKAAQDTTKKVAQETTKQVTKETTKVVAEQTVVQGSTAVATGGTTVAAGGTAIVGQAAIPMVGWIMLAIEAAIALIAAAVKITKKIDKKSAESGVDSKGLRKLFWMAPILAPIALVILILVLLVQTETTEKVDFLSDAIKCFESTTDCNDFMNTGVKINSRGKKVIKATDNELARFVEDYVRAEKKYFDTGILSDLMEELDDLAREGILDDRSEYERIKDSFQQLLEDSIIGDINYAWTLMKWMKMEKKVFNNIQWYKAYVETGSSCSSLAQIEAWANMALFNETPNIGFQDVAVVEAWTWGFHGFDEAYLKVPVCITVDEAIELTEPYIPSWVELYATYVATGDKKLTNSIYDHYLDEDQYELVVTLYQLLTVTQTTKAKR